MSIEILESNQQVPSNTLSKILVHKNPIYIKTERFSCNGDESDLQNGNAFFASHLEQLDEMIGKIASRLSSLDK